MKKIHITVIAIILIVLIKFSSTYLINQNCISKYNKGIYNENYLNANNILNFWQAYIVHYNKGNIFYKNSNFEEAINEYEKALKALPPKDKECKIRINLALAMIKNTESKEGVTTDELLQTLDEAKKILSEKGCANSDEKDGHNKDAIQLKKDIEEYEEKLKQQQKQESKSKQEQKNNDKKNESNQQQSDDEKQRKENELKNKQKQSNGNRQEKIDSTQSSKDYKYYKGKSW